MTDRIHSLTVVLAQDMRDDDAQAVMRAIACFAGVIEVSGNVTDVGGYVAQARARAELGEKILDVIYPGRVRR